MSAFRIEFPVGGGEDAETTSLRACVIALDLLSPWTAHRVAAYLADRYPSPDPDS